MKIVITQEDVKNAGGFNNTTNCPLAKVMQKALNNPHILVGTFKIVEQKSNHVSEYIGEINPSFEYLDYSNLLNGEIKEFVTEYTEYEKSQEN